MPRHAFPGTLPEHVRFDELAAGASSAAEEPLVIAFTPVPRLRLRRSGWTDERQRGFIAALARCGNVSAAARHVGVTPRSAWRLCDAPGADSFVAAWDEALDIGMARMCSDSLQRAVEGDYVPVYRRGKLVRVEHRRNDRLAIALMAGREKICDHDRRTALSRRQYRVDLAALDAARRAEAPHRRGRCRVPGRGRPADRKCPLRPPAARRLLVSGERPTWSPSPRLLRL